MKRLYRVSFDILLTSVIPIISWFLLGILIDRNLINVFTLTYPMQFIYTILKAIFSTGANITKEKNRDSNAVDTGITLGIIIGFVIFGFFALNVDKYISFMNMDINIYKEFCVYSIIQMYLQLILSFVQTKLYYENKTKLANKYSITFNSLNLIVLVLSSLIFRNKILIVIITLMVLIIYITIISFKNCKKFIIKSNVFNFIKYNSIEIVKEISFFITYLFGLSNAISYGQQYANAITFVALITDTQWDMLEAINVVAKIDISKKMLNYKEHLKNGYKLLTILIVSVLILFIGLNGFYELDLGITAVFLGIEILSYLLELHYQIKRCYLQLEYSIVKININNLFAYIPRTLISFLPTPFCTALGQLYSVIYQFISINIIFYKNYKIDSKTVDLKSEILE